MFRITYTWGHYTSLKMYEITDDPFQTMADILALLPGAKILEVI